jgi:protein tyrosine phosphatase
MRICVLIDLNIQDDDTRVRLQRGSNDYINANFVEVPWANRTYILTQVNILSFGLIIFNLFE